MVIIEDKILYNSCNNKKILIQIKILKRIKKAK